MLKLATPFVLVTAIGIASCGTTTGERAGRGALIGSLSADAGKGALIGAGLGAVGAYLYDRLKKGNID